MTTFDELAIGAQFNWHDENPMVLERVKISNERYYLHDKEANTFEVWSVEEQGWSKDDVFNIINPVVLMSSFDKLPVGALYSSDIDYAVFPTHFKTSGSQARCIGQQWTEEVDNTKEPVLWFNKYANDPFEEQNKETEVNAVGAKQSKIDAAYTLLPALAVAEVSKVLKSGGKKYGLNNWRGIPAMEHTNHSMHHQFGAMHIVKGDGEQELTSQQRQEYILHLSHAACRALFALEAVLTD